MVFGTVAGRVRLHARSVRPQWLPVLLVALTLPVLLASCGGGSGSVHTTTTVSRRADPFTVPAVREPLTSVRDSSVVHDVEVMGLATHDGRLFAATDQWEYRGRSAFGQVLVKRSRSAQWKVVEETGSTRVQAIDSFPIPADQGLGPGHSLLITQAIIDGRSELQWLLDGATSFSPDDSFVLPGEGAEVRSFGAHESGGVWSVYAGDDPTGILRGTWSRSLRTLVFDPTPELSAAPPGSRGAKTQKVTGFADCGGALYVTINTTLYRRNDGSLPAGVGQWVAIYTEGRVGAFNSGLRGISCITHDAAPSLLFSKEGSGDIYRIDDLPTGQLARPETAEPRGEQVTAAPVLEFDADAAIRQMLAAQSVIVPATGSESIDYVIAAYNNFETVDIGGVDRQLFGFSWHYQGACPVGRICTQGAVHADATACFGIRTDDASGPTYVLRCLGGPDFTPTAQQSNPVQSGQAFVAPRTIKESPFGDGRVYLGGYDANFYPADGTAWIGSLQSSEADVARGPVVTAP